VFSIHSSFGFLIGFACGYAVRAFLSRRRRAIAREEWEFRKGHYGGVPPGPTEQVGRQTASSSEKNG
jgi:hypothetical protein